MVFSVKITGSSHLSAGVGGWIRSGVLPASFSEISSSQQRQLNSQGGVCVERNGSSLRKILGMFAAGPAVAAGMAVRFVADRVWGSEGKAHIFTLEYR